MKRNEILIVSLATLREMIAETKDEAKAIRTRSGIPHPLNRFGLNGEVKSGAQADMLMDCLNATALEKAGSIGWRSARWFLLESTMFFEVCTRAGIDARKWRKHLAHVFRLLDHRRRVNPWRRQPTLKWWRGF